MFDRGRFPMMKPTQSILDDSFRYVPAVATSVVQTWRRFGWQPTTDDERKRRLGTSPRIAADGRSPANVSTDTFGQRTVAIAGRAAR